MNKIELEKGDKKVGIVSLGARISLDAKNVRSVDLRYTRDYLMNVFGRKTVDYISHRTKKEAELPYFKEIEAVDFNNYDEIFIYNSSYNPFGGVFDYSSFVTFEKLYDFKGSIYYMLLDPKMPPRDFSKYLLSRDKDNSHIFKCDVKNCREGYKINDEIIMNWSEKVFNRIDVAFAGADYEKYVSLYNPSHTDKWDAVNENVNWFNFWIFEYYAVNEELKLKLKDYNKDFKNGYDLMYFGNNRQNERNKIIKNYYNIPEFKKLCIGFDPELENTDVLEYLAHDDLFRTIGNKCLSTVVVGDILHDGNIRTPRFFEAMLLDCVAFISTTFDPNKDYVKNEKLRDFIYVSNRDELKERIEKIKADPNLYKEIVKLERDEILGTFSEYMITTNCDGSQPTMGQEPTIDELF